MSGLNQLINLAISEENYIEKVSNKDLDSKSGNRGDKNFTKYSRDVNAAGLSGCQGQSWCCTHQFWLDLKVFGKEKALKLWNMTAETYVGYNCFATYRAFADVGKVGKVPKLGALVVFTFSHIGRVLRVYQNNGVTYFDCEEGNTSSNLNDRNGGMVKIRRRVANDSTIKGFCYIDYESADTNGSQVVEGWIKVGGNWRYQLSDETYISNAWKYINDRWYMFDGTGNMCTGWVFSNNQWYYCCPEVGCMDVGWQMVNGKWYFMDSDGVMRVGWLQDKDKWYYLCENGEMAIGWKQIADQWYVFGDDGHMYANTWFKSEDDWYYLSSTGAMKKSQWIQHEDGNFYYVTDSGKMAKSSWIKDEYKERYYFVDNNGIYKPEMDAPDAKYPIVE